MIKRLLLLTLLLICLGFLFPSLILAHDEEEDEDKKEFTLKDPEVAVREFKEEVESFSEGLSVKEYRKQKEEKAKKEEEKKEHWEKWEEEDKPDHYYQRGKYIFPAGGDTPAFYIDSAGKIIPYDN